VTNQPTGLATPVVPPDLAAAADAVVDHVATALANPAAVSAAVTATGGDRWVPLSLTDGHPAIALLYAELARADGAHRRTAHAHLAAGLTHAGEPVFGLFHGPAALAFAAARAAQRAADYAGLLGVLDDRLAAWTARRLAPELERIAARTPGTAFAAYDVVSGVTGVARYLLQRGHHDPVQEVLNYLVALSEPVGELPGWWVGHTPSPHGPSDHAPSGHANSGLAHGVPGPLALLALAWRAGVRAPGQAAAADRIAGWLLEWSDVDNHGRYWPAGLDRVQLRDRPEPLAPARTGWCYGTPGVARALQLAGDAFDRPDWTATAVDALGAMLRRPPSGYGVSDAGLCHGWAGLLHITGTVARETGSTDLLAGADRLAARVVAAHEPDRPFGFRIDGEDVAGFLEGAAGTALALQAWRTGGTGGWDAALLVA
jgi:hypothetical protein